MVVLPAHTLFTTVFGRVYLQYTVAAVARMAMSVGDDRGCFGIGPICGGHVNYRGVSGKWEVVFLEWIGSEVVHA